MKHPYVSQTAMMGRPAYLDAYTPPRPQKVTVSGYQGGSFTPNVYENGAKMSELMRHTPEAPYVAPEPIVQALRQRSLNPDGIRRNADTFKGTTNAPVAPEGKTNPSGVNRSTQVTSQV